MLACVAGCGGGGGDAAPASDTRAAGSSTAAAAAAPAPAAQAPSTGTETSPPAPGATANTLGFTFTLDRARTTSAGIFASDGRLLRTLWRGERLDAGRHTRQWDLRLDDGQLASAAEVSVRVIHHDVRYVWQGVVGNSTAAAGHAPQRSFQPPASLAADGDQLHIALGYNEAQSSLSGLRLGDVQRVQAAVKHTDPFTGIGLVASDGQTLYLAQTGGISKAGFVFARRLADGQMGSFTQGQALCLNVWAGTQRCYPEQTYPSVIAHRPEGEALPTGLAVQRQGRLLAVAYAAEQRVRVYDKLSGALLADWRAPLAPAGRNQLAMGADGDLWLLGSGQVLRYTDIAGSPREVARLTGLDQPLALATDPTDAQRVWVAEGGAAQWVRRFDLRTGQADRSLGRRGGLQGLAEAAADRLCFAAAAGAAHSALAVDGQGHVWVADTCNNRLQRFTPEGTVAASVAWLPASYTAAVDGARPQRVFANFLEFEVAASPAADGRPAWRLVRNWLPTLPATLRDEHAANLHWGGFTAVHTLANGRSYAQMNVKGSSWVVELGSDGRVRAVQTLQPGDAKRTAEVMQANGDLHHAVDDGAMQRVMRRRLEGLGTDGLPRWATSATVLASLPRSAGAPFHRMGTYTGVMDPRWPLTDSGLVISFDPGVTGNEGFHLGAAALGGSAWAWQASPSGPLDGKGSFQTQASDSKIHYGGNVAMVSGRQVVYGYHGEFYTDLSNGRVGQANQFMHFLDNGLFVGQFGRPSTQGDGQPVPGLSGNAFSPWLVRHEGRSFLYHNDESSWGGVHRWELQGLDDIAELRASGVRGTQIELR